MESSENIKNEEEKKDIKKEELNQKEEDIKEDRQNKKEDNQNSEYIKKYNSESELFGLCFQNNSNQLRLLASSKNISNDNYIELLEYSKEEDNLNKVSSIKCTFPPTKVMFSPEEQNKNIFISTSDNLKIYKFNENESSIDLVESLSRGHNIYFGPLTSCDWSTDNHSIVGVSSIDTTCTIWDINKMEVKQQIISQAKEVYDISFGKCEYNFMAAGAEGCVNVFDTRNKESCSVIFETGDRKAITNISWNLVDENYALAVCQDKSQVIIIDRRNTFSPFNVVKGHKGSVNNAIWMPGSKYCFISVSEDKNAIIWDINGEGNAQCGPYMSYKANGEIENVAWGDKTMEWIGICYGKTIEILKVQ